MTVDRRLSNTVEILKPTLSPTGLDHAAICGRRLQYYLDPDVPHGGTNLSLARGQAWHQMMETWGRYRMMLHADDPSAAPVDWLDDRGWSGDPQYTNWLNRLYAVGIGWVTEVMNSEDFVPQPDDDFDEVAGQLWAMLMVWAKSRDAMWLGDGITFETVEARVLTELGSEHHQLNGYIDAVVNITTESRPELAHYEGLSERTVQTVLVDYKSAGRMWGTDRCWFDESLGRYIGDPRKIMQAPLYAEGWERSTGEVVDWVAFDVMTVKGKFRRVWVPVNYERRAPLLERWRQVSNEIAMYQEAGVDMPANPGHFMCSEKWCPFWDRCPMGAPYGKAKRESEKQ